MEASRTSWTAADLRAQEEPNWLLASLPARAYERVVVLCETVALPLKTVVIVPDEPIEYAYFPRSGTLSIVSVMDDGDMVEVGTVGREGMAGVSLVHGVTAVPTKCLVQMAGISLRLPAAVLLEQMSAGAELRDVLVRYAEVWLNQVSRGSSCNAVHCVEQRCARWLLAMHDRVEGDVLPLTHELLSIMLGVRRASVTLAANALQDAGLITYRHGKVVIVNRPGLENASCACYAATRAVYRALLPLAGR